MESKEDKIALMDSVPFFKSFTKLEKHTLAKDAICFLNYRAGEIIIKQGERDDTLYVLLKGFVQVTKDTPKEKGIVLAKLLAGAIFGELSMLLRRPRSTNIVADTSVIVWKINVQRLEEMDLAIQKKIKDKVVELLVQRLDEMDRKFIQVAGAKTKPLP